MFSILNFLKGIKNIITNKKFVFESKVNFFYYFIYR